MGCRRNFFILSKIRSRYHTLVVATVQEMFEMETVELVLNIFRVFRAGANHISIGRELQKTERINWYIDTERQSCADSG